MGSGPAEVTLRRASREFVKEAEKLPGSRGFAAYVAFNVSRVELLLALGEHAGALWEPDLALLCLRAADRATANVDHVTCPGNPFEEGPVERRLRTCLVLVVQSVLFRFEHDETYADMATDSSPAAFRDLLQDVRRREELAELHRLATLTHGTERGKARAPEVSNVRDAQEPGR
jgi:hypothetical protein